MRFPFSLSLAIASFMASFLFLLASTLASTPLTLGSAFSWLGSGGGGRLFAACAFSGASRTRPTPAATRPCISCLKRPHIYYVDCIYEWDRGFSYYAYLLTFSHGNKRSLLLLSALLRLQLQSSVSAMRKGTKRKKWEEEAVVPSNGPFCCCAKCCSLFCLFDPKGNQATGTVRPS